MHRGALATINSKRNKAGKYHIIMIYVHYSFANCDGNIMANEKDTLVIRQLQDTESIKENRITYRVKMQGE